MKQKTRGLVTVRGFNDNELQRFARESKVFSMFSLSEVVFYPGICWEYLGIEVDLQIRVFPVCFQK